MQEENQNQSAVLQPAGPAVQGQVPNVDEIRKRLAKIKAQAF